MGRAATRQPLGGDTRVDVVRVGGRGVHQGMGVGRRKVGDAVEDVAGGAGACSAKEAVGAAACSAEGAVGAKGATGGAVAASSTLSAFSAAAAEVAAYLFGLF